MRDLLKAEGRQLRWNKLLWCAVIAVAAYTCYQAAGLRNIESPEVYLEGDLVISGEIYLFQGILGQTFLSIWVCALLPVLLIGRDFAQREINYILMSGNSRMEYFLLKLAETALFTGILCTVPPVVIALVGMKGQFVGLFSFGTGYVIRCVLLRFFCDLALASIGMLLAFLFRDEIKSMAFSVGHAILLQLLYTVYMQPYQNRGSFVYRLLRYHPLFAYGNGMAVELTAQELTGMLGVSLGIATAAGIASYLAFRTADLK